MVNGLGGFLVSASIVGTGLTGFWAWPHLQEGGFQSLAAQAAGLYHGAEMRRRPAIAALQSPPELAGARLVDPAATAESLPPAALSPVEPLRSEPAAPVVSAQCEAREDNQDTAVIGDRVQLRIFESSILAAAPAPVGTEAPVTDIVFERLDLSGTYEVGTTGAVSLPAIGHVDVAGHSLSCIEALVSRAAFERMRTQNTVSAAYAARPPILVRGAVRSPGAHSYNPGLTVERILAQVGALDDRDPAAKVRLITLDARRSELDKTRIGLTLDRLRIEAALNDHDSLPEEHPVLHAALTLLGKDRVASERNALASEIQASRLRRAQSEATLADFAARIETARRQKNLAETQMAYHADRQEHQNEMLESGFITDSRLNDTALRAMDAERILLEKEDLLFRLEAEHRAAAQDAELARVDRIKALSAELRQVSVALDTVGSELDTVVAELNIYENVGLRLAVTIERPVDGARAQTIAANAETLVRPGDLVTVSGNGAQEEDLVDGARPAPLAIIRSALKE
jgi:protein involved in polysaccharide export with SLBB domain